MTNGTELGSILHRTAPEAFIIEGAPATFEMVDGTRAAGIAEIDISRTSITIRFASDQPLTLVQAVYGQSSGRISAVDGAWQAGRVNFIASETGGQHLFVTQELIVDHGGADAAYTRLLFAGARLDGDIAFGGSVLLARTLSHNAVNHHDTRLGIVAPSVLDDVTIQRVLRAGSFVAGLDIEPLRYDLFAKDGALVRSRHVRGARRLARGAHSPFTGVKNADKIAALSALLAALPDLEARGEPIVAALNNIAASNQVSELDPGAVLLLLAVQAMATYHAHGEGSPVPAVSRVSELAALNHALDLHLSADDLERYESLRIELLDTGLFQKPGYESGRPQNEVKFIRDIAHLIIFRLCGYRGPYYRSETFDIQSAG